SSFITSVVLPKKFKGFTYGFLIDVPVVNQRIETPRLPVNGLGHIGMSDLFVAPIVLGFTKPRVEATLNYGFYAPTGSFTSNRVANLGLGFWENQIQGGATV